MALLKSIQALKGGSIKIMRGQNKDSSSNNNSMNVESVDEEAQMYGKIMQ